MKKSLFILSTIIALTFVSCATTKISVGDPDELVKIEKSSTNPDMEFIGFYATTDTLPGTVTDIYNSSTITSNKVDLWKSFYSDSDLQNFGELLADANIAYNNQENYLGDFSTTDLANYKSRKGARYVTFIEINDYSCTYVEKNTNSTFISLGSSGLLLGPTLALMGAMTSGDEWAEAFPGIAKASPVLLWGGLGLAAAGAGSLAYGLIKPAKTTFHFEAEVKLCVYDTQDKAFVSKKVLKSGPYSDEFTGSYKSSDSDAYKAVTNFYGVKFKNDLLNKYKTLESSL